MLEQKEHFHGSDLEKIEKVYNIKMKQGKMHLVGMPNK